MTPTLPPVFAEPSEASPAAGGSPAEISLAPSPEVLPVSAESVLGTDTEPIAIPDEASAALSVSTVTAATTADASSLETLATVSTATDSSLRRNHRRENSCVTDAIDTAEGASENDCAKPVTYAARFA